MNPALILTTTVSVLAFGILVAGGALTLKYSTWLVGNIRLPYVRGLKLIIAPALCLTSARWLDSLFGISVTYGIALVITLIVSWVVFSQYICDSKGVPIGNFVGILIALLNLLVLFTLFIGVIFLSVVVTDFFFRT